MNTSKLKLPYSFLAIIITSLVLVLLTFVYYPKWKKDRTEATISWDVSGYYFYLPSIFIYKDLKKVGFKQKIQDQYSPASSSYQTYTFANGNEVMKYSGGMALIYSPFFGLGHIGAKLMGAPKDGFSKPYQLAIAIQSVLIAILGLLLARLILLRYFTDHVTALALISIALATNYLEYASISGAMTHNYLFTIYTAVILLTIRYYDKPGAGGAITIGALCGLAVLVRPTEMIIVFIPLLWNINLSDWKSRVEHFIKRKQHVAGFLLGAIPVGFIQMAYWQYVTGHWFVYSYEEQGFNWLNPHLIKGLFNTRAGWFVYSPIMALSLIGFYHLWRHKRFLFAAIGIVSFFGMYINFAWDQWTYGGSLGQRALIQLYPVLMFALAAFYEQMLKNKWSKYLLYIIISACLYLMVWWVHQAHLGRYFVPGEVNTKYLANVIGKWHFDRDYYKLLDKTDIYKGVVNNPDRIYQNDFEIGPFEGCVSEGIQSEKGICVSQDAPWSPLISIPTSNRCGDWIRTQVKVYTPEKEWEIWKMGQMVVKFLRGEQVVKDNMIRIHRIMNHGETRTLFIDSDVRNLQLDMIQVQFWNPGSNKKVVIDDLEVFCF
jgi:hypothetical protein